jgi:CheY-like chemotaxis protein
MGGLAAEEAEFLTHIMKSGRHLLSLINEILDIARVEAGRAEFSIEPVCLSQAIGESVAMLLPLAGQANISFNVDPKSIESSHVMADVQRLKQVAINLLSNGVKYNREGGQVDISCESTPEGKTRILFKDTGRGIASEDREKLFTPFQRLDADSQNIEGSGLGLVLSRNLVEAMGGTLTMESVLGEGSTFIIELPTASSLVEAFESTAAPCRDQVPVESGKSSYSVLCIEDNMANLHLVTHILASRPELKLMTAMQGSVGLDLARQHRPDLILLDLDLPDISGKEVLAKLRENEITRNIPVIMVTADATRPQAEFVMAAGAQAYMTKPLDVQEFLATIERILGGDWNVPLAS